jgi:hypothetical protein
MRRTLPQILAIAALMPIGLALAADVPAPVKKPRDKAGAADTRVPSSKQVDSQRHHPAPDTAAAEAKATSMTATKATVSKSEPSASTATITTGAVKSKVNSNGKSQAAGEPIPVEPSGKPAATAPTDAKPAVPVEWTGTEIEAAKNHCAAVLKGLNVVAIPEPPKRDGQCGTPAPFRLISIGSSPQVSLDPPALLTCDMIFALSKWMTNDLQPLAKKYLGAELIKIETMSDYSCRAAYGRSGNKWSEHAFANALDIRGFVTASAERAYVLESWGNTRRDVEAARLAAQKVAADKIAAAKAAAEKANAMATKTPATIDQNKIADGASVPTSTATSSTSDSKPSFVETTITPLKGSETAKTGLGFQEPSRLGGPKDKKSKSAEIDSAPTVGPTLGPKGRMVQFLHEAHASACRIFGTTLGPEANNAHRNHFHVDMAPRKSTKFCE